MYALTKGSQEKKEKKKKKERKERKEHIITIKAPVGANNIELEILCCQRSTMPTVYFVP